MIAPQSNSLPREVLRWLQGLDLSYTIKNVKRDFANGYLFAEICSRYFANDVSLHNYSNGTSMTSKNDNWFQLKRLLAKCGVEVTTEHLTEIVHCKDGAAVALVEQLYSHLTERKLIKMPKLQQELKVPAFARDTASNLIKRRLREPDLIHMQDELAREHSLIKTLSEHNSRTSQERRIHRDEVENSVSSESKSDSKFASSLSMSNTASGSALKPDQSSSPVGTASQKRVEVKMVQVKQIDTNLSALRARQLAGRASPIEVGSFGSGRSKAGASASSLPKESIIETLSQTLASALPDGCLVSAKPNEPVLQTFVRTLSDGVARACTGSQLVQRNKGLSDADLLGAFGSIAERLDSVDHPIDAREFWRTVHLFISMLELVADADDSFQACTDACVRFAHMMVRQVDLHQNPGDRRALLDMFLDAGLSRLTEILRSTPRKRHACLTFIDVFAEHEPSTRRYLIKRLHDSLNQTSSFLQCLTILIFMEQSLSASGPGMALLDLYTYYGLMGLSNSSSSLRAASLAMFAVILQHEPSTASRLLPKMQDLTADSWWEVQCQVLIVCSKVLDYLVMNLDEAIEQQHHDDATRAEEAIDELNDQLEETVQIIAKVFTCQAPVNVCKVGLVYLGRHLRVHPQLGQIYSEVLLNLSRKSYQDETDEHHSLIRLLGLVPEIEELPLPSASGGRYHLAPIVSSWDVHGMALELERIIQESDLQNLEYWHLEILNALVQDTHRGLHGEGSDTHSEGRASTGFHDETKSTFAGEDDDSFQKKLFETFKDLVFLALCDPVNYSLANFIIRTWALVPEFEVMEARSFAGALRLLYSQPPRETTWNGQQAMADLLIDLHNSGPRLANAVTQCVSKLCTNYPELLENDILCDMEQKLE